MALEEVSAVAEPVEAAAEEVDAVDPVGTEEAAETTEEVQAPEAAAEDVTGDGRTIPPALRELFKEHKDARAAWFERAEFRKTFPEGPKQAAEVMSIIADIGGREGIDALKGDATGLKELQSQIDAGDTKVIERMATESPEGFAKLAPEVMSKWYQVDPEGCNKTLCGVIANTLAQGQFNSTLERAALFLEVGKPEKAIEVLQQLQNWANTFTETAKKPLEPKKAPEVDKRVAELDQREAGLFNRDLSNKIIAFRDPLIEKELSPYIPKGQTIDPVIKETIIERAVKDASAILDGDKDFQNKWRSFISNKDADGAAKLSRSKLSEILPGVVKKVAPIFIKNPGAKKTAPPVATKPVVKPPVKGDTWDDIFEAARTRA